MATKSKLTGSSATANGPMTTGVSSSQEMKWQAEDALRDMERAAKHKRDPKLMAEVAKVRDDKMKDLKNIDCDVSEKTIKMPK